MWKLVERLGFQDEQARFMLIALQNKDGWSFKWDDKHERITGVNVTVRPESIKSTAAVGTPTVIVGPPPKNK